MSRIGLVDLAVAYNGRRVVDGVSMHIEPRTWVALIGPMGQKSTLLAPCAVSCPTQARSTSVACQPPR